MPDEPRPAQTPPPSRREAGAIDVSPVSRYEFLSDETLAALPANLGDQARAFREAARAADGGAGTPASGGAPAGGAGGNLAEWAQQSGKLIVPEEIERLPVVSNSTSEHEVFYRAEDGRAVKRTWAGFYGQVPAPEAGRLGRRNATAAEYLRRMALQIVVFQSDLKLEGVTVSDRPSMILGEPAGQPSLVVSQEWYVKEGRAAHERIRERLEAEGFREVAGSYFGWVRAADRVVIVDAKPDNWIQTDSGLVPIDLQMTVFSVEQMRDAGLADRDGGAGK